jgi:hypothetical protein
LSDETSNIETSFPIELNSLNTSTYFFQEALTTGINIEQLRLYIKYPMRYNMQIRKLSRESYNSNGQYNNVISYMTAIPSLDFITVCRENTSVNQKKRKIFNNIFKKINHKAVTRDICLSAYIDGMFIGILRNTKANNTNPQLQQGFVDSLDRLEGLSMDDNLQIQPLDLDYCKIIGVQNGTQVAAFNLMYFNQFKHGGLLNEIKNFPPEFAKAYLAYQKDASKQWFALDTKSTIVIKFNANTLEPYGRPIGLAALFDIRFADDYYMSQINTVSDLASSIYSLTLPEGAQTGSCSLNKEQQKNLVSAFESAVSSNTSNTCGKSKISKLTLAPGATIARMTKDASLLKDTLSDENIKKISTSLGFASSALNASSEGGASYSTLQVNVDLILVQIFALIEQIAFEYTRVLNNLISSKGEEIVDIIYLKTTILNQEKSVGNAKDLYTLGGGSRLYWIACAGADVDMYMSLMEYEREQKFDERFPPHLTSFTATGDSNGRPTETDPKNSNTIKSKSLGSNKQPKPSN